MEINQDRAGHFIVQRLEPQGPSERSKISVGDRLLKVGRTQVDGLRMEEVVKLIRGKVGSKVRLKLRSESRTHSVVVTRKSMPPSNERIQNRKNPHGDAAD